MMRLRLRAALSLAALLLCTSALATPSGILFDFEEQNDSIFHNAGDFEVLRSVKGGLALMLTRQNADLFDVWDVSAPNWNGGPASWGQRTLSPFYSDSTNSFVANFSQDITSASIECGDYGWDRDEVFVRAYSGADGTGTMLGEDTNIFFSLDSIENGGYCTVSLNGLTGARSLVFGGGGDSTRRYDPVFWDNLRVTVANPVPEPAFYQMGGLLLFGGLGALRLRRRA